MFDYKAYREKNKDKFDKYMHDYRERLKNESPQDHKARIIYRRALKKCLSHEDLDLQIKIYQKVVDLLGQKRLRWKKRQPYSAVIVEKAE